MPRISGVDIPAEKRIEIALTYIYGIGKTLSNTICKKARVDANIRAGKLTPGQLVALQKVLDGYNIEGDLRKMIRDNIVRLRRIGSYRGKRHSAGLPVRGQRTRTNARTKRGKRKTVGAMKKKDLQKLEAAKRSREKREG